MSNRPNPFRSVGWQLMDTAPAGRDVRLKCSDGKERIGRHHEGAMWSIKNQPGVYVLDSYLKAADAKGMVEATHWRAV